MDLKVAEMMTYDIIAKILSLLPVRSLVRFRCVSKLWYSLTYDPYFQEEQLKISSTRRKYIIYRDYFVNKKMKKMIMYSIDTTKKIKDGYFKIDFDGEDGESTYYAYTLSNSVNGLICARGGGDKKESSCYLTNLSTREVEKLPEDSSRNILYHKLFLGLGFDASSGEYKVIMLSSKIRFSFHYKILTLGSNQDWRYVAEIPCEPIIPMSLVFVNGKLHWLAGSNKRSGFVAIFTIDMKDETHGTIAPPVPFRLSWIDNGINEVAIQEDEEGCLVFLHISLKEMRIWTMKDYITHQWTNTYNMDSDLFLQPEMLLEPEMLFGLAYNKVLFCAEESKSEGMTESRSKRMAVCSIDLQTETFQKHCRVIYSNMESYFYSESLLSPRNLLYKDTISSNNK